MWLMATTDTRSPKRENIVFINVIVNVIVRTNFYAQSIPKPNKKNVAVRQRDAVCDFRFARQKQGLVVAI